MKIKATCKNCDKDLLLEQVLSTGGSCPWCGETFQKDYAAVLVDAIGAAQSSVETLENALEKMAELQPRFRVNGETVTGQIDTALRQLG